MTLQKQNMMDSVKQSTHLIEDVRKWDKHHECYISYCGANKQPRHWRVNLQRQTGTHSGIRSTPACRYLILHDSYSRIPFMRRDMDPSSSKLGCPIHLQLGLSGTKLAMLEPRTFLPKLPPEAPIPPAGPAFRTVNCLLLRTCVFVLALKGTGLRQDWDSSGVLSGKLLPLVPAMDEAPQTQAGTEADD